MHEGKANIRAQPIGWAWKKGQLSWNKLVSTGPFCSVENDKISNFGLESLMLTTTRSMNGDESGLGNQSSVLSKEIPPKKQRSIEIECVRLKSAWSLHGLVSYMVLARGTQLFTQSHHMIAKNGFCQRWLRESRGEVQGVLLFETERFLN